MKPDINPAGAEKTPADEKKPLRVGIIGGGAAGMTAAYFASLSGAAVTLFERGDRLGRKLAITGKGRCNLTNDCTLDEFLANVPTNSRFLYSAFNAFPPRSVMAFFEGLGVPLKVERGNRVFPVSDRAGDIVNALKKSLTCRIINERVTGILTADNPRDDTCAEVSDSDTKPSKKPKKPKARAEKTVTGIRTERGEYNFDRVILATGGASYPRTGSDGDGFRMARALGISTVPLTPSLVPLEVKESWCKALQGLSLKNTALKVFDTVENDVIYTDFGELLFAHFGLTGPMILSASAMLTKMAPGRYQIILDLKPALDAEKLDSRVRSDFLKYSNRDFANALSDLLPQKLIPVIVALSGIPETKKVNSITREERAALVALLKALTLTVTRFRPLDEAIITKGGVSVSEIDPKTMESKRVAGLYFAGEVIDVDAYTGGFNLQIAFSTGKAAGIGSTEDAGMRGCGDARMRVLSLRERTKEQ